ncbi:LOW QUALITY PROTEIN: hypothetical protein PHMEG_00024069 [Phytophthora megakarya]|uniref:Eukaryotic/viral aspartic protease n=1 Tax=Phytophthora megakarya TaxID=4795 RepID=A0A225VHV5_9STRA|nr:LOW QUALITY PROTEIN: hypothetical protein PHMEG_00024069 [Phytophthora megakarya]
MQWLRGFVYEMKGTRASPDMWCMPFQLSWKDGVLHWHRQLPKKPKRTWSLLSKTRYYSAKREDKEHLCDYLNRLNEYARKREYNLIKVAERHEITVSWKLAAIVDSNDRLCHVKVYDIHELEEMIIENPRGGYSLGDRRDRDFGRHRDDSRNIPRVTFAEGSKALETQKTYSSDEDDSHDIYDDYNDYDNHDGWNADESRYTDEQREEYDDSADEDDFVAAANEVERRNETDGTYARSDVRVPKTEQSRGFNRDHRFQRQRNTDRFPQRQYGPCGACGDMSHSTHFCRRRCKFCKQIEEPGLCDVFQERTKLFFLKVDKKDIAPELQILLFGEHLN